MPKYGASYRGYYTHHKLVAIEMIKGTYTLHALCKTPIMHIRRLLQEFETAEVSHIHRECNSVADFLSHYAYTFSRGVHILDSPLEEVKTSLFYDVIGIFLNVNI